MSTLAANVAVAASILQCGVALVLAAVGGISWARVRHGRLMAATLAFVVLAAQGLVLALAAYQQRGKVAEGEMLLPWVAGLGLLTVACLYVAVLKR
jgi:hypothetical protein